jgi:propionyl-CoA carboxylase alpha chain
MAELYRLMPHKAPPDMSRFVLSPMPGLLVQLAVQPGQKVRVSKQVTFMHVPGHKDGFQAQGSVGIVTRVIDESNLSPNRKVKIQFEEPKKWAGHFESFELEVVAS